MGLNGSMIVGCGDHYIGQVIKIPAGTPIFNINPKTPAAPVDLPEDGDQSRYFPAHLDSTTLLRQEVKKQLDKQLSKDVPGLATTTTDYVYAQAAKINDLLRKQGLSEKAAWYGTYQSYFETGAWSSPQYRNMNNASGIKFAGQAGATKGPGGFANFKDLTYWAKAMAHEMRKKANPAGATSLEDYNRRLVANHYYEANKGQTMAQTAAQYLAGMQRAQNLLSMVATHKNDASEKPGHNSHPIPWWGWVLMGTGLYIVVKRATR